MCEKIRLRHQDEFLGDVRAVFVETLQHPGHIVSEGHVTPINIVVIIDTFTTFAQHTGGRYLPNAWGIYATLPSGYRCRAHLQGRGR